MNASHEIVKEATKAKVETFFKSVSSSLNLLNLQNDVKEKESEKSSSQQSQEDKNTATNILNITADISKTLAQTVDIGSSVDIKLPNISMTVMKKKTGTSNSSIWEADSLKVSYFNKSKYFRLRQYDSVFDAPLKILDCSSNAV